MLIWTHVLFTVRSVRVEELNANILSSTFVVVPAVGDELLARRIETGSKTKHEGQVGSGVTLHRPNH